MLLLLITEGLPLVSRGKKEHVYVSVGEEFDFYPHFKGRMDKKCRDLFNLMINLFGSFGSFPRFHRYQRTVILLQPHTSGLFDVPDQIIKLTLGGRVIAQRFGV